MFLEFLHLRSFYYLLILCLHTEYFFIGVQSITVAHQLSVGIRPPIPTKRDKTLWIGGKTIEQKKNKQIDTHR